MRYLFHANWKFLHTPVGTGYEEALKRKADFCEVELPHDWLIYDAQNLYKDGTGWYRKLFEWERKRGERVFLTFEGIYMDSAVFVNGKKAGEWKYGYSAFSTEITELLVSGENEVMVSACFQSPNSRWYSGAGIYRNVWLRVTGKTCIEEDGVYVSTRKQGKDFLMQVETCIDGEQSPGLQVEHRLCECLPAGEQGKAVKLQLLSEENNRKTYLVKEPRLWDTENPYLYCLQTRLLMGEEVLDESQSRIGFRCTEFLPDKGFFLNGKHVKLKGVCEHHDLGALGAAFSKAAMRRKFRILKEMGVNAVRGSHNMMAPEAMDLADEMGLLVISEAFDMWEMSKTPYDYARFFKEWSGKDVKSWICRDRNHPCVIMWSIGNEIYDTHADEHGQEITKYLMDLVKEYDSEENARVTLGSNYMPWENAGKCADLYKLAGYNYSEKYYREHHEIHPDWVIYGSETSSIVQSRGVYHFPLRAGILAEDDEQCSALGNSATSWGAKSMEDCITLDRDTEFSMGQFLWTGFDYIGEPTPYHTKNSYFGQIDTAGFPKDSYYVWQSAWTDYHKKPMVHVFPYWDFNPGQMIDVRVCSNAPVVELFVNGRSLGRQMLNHLPGSGKRIIADYQVPYEEGVLTAVGYDEDEKEIARQERCSFGDSEAVVIEPENTVIQADGKDMLFLQISTADRQGKAVENACDRVFVKVSGAGRLVGLDNGDSTDFDSYKGISRRLFNGKLLAMVQAKKEPGEIVIQVEAKGLKGAELICRSVAVKEAPKEQDLEKTDATEPVRALLPAERTESLSIVEENRERAIVLGRADEVPVRKILLQAPEERVLRPERKEILVKAHIAPEQADDRELIFKAVNDMGVDSNLVTMERHGNEVLLRGLGDGAFRLRCMSKSGTEKIRLISQLEFRIEGMGQAYLNPYGFISGSQYTRVKGEAGNGNEKGVATARDGETVVTYENIDFGPVGADEITVPIFALSGEAYPIQIWEGIPGHENSCLLADVVYQKPSIWNVYQAETWKLSKCLRGITSISFLLRQKVHIKGFSFTKREKAWMKLEAFRADAIYGDSFERTKQGIERIGNNVSLVFSGMDFKEAKALKLRIYGRAPKGKNTIHVRYFNGEDEIKQIVEFAQAAEWEEQEFTLQPIAGKWDVTFVFLPGSCFDFGWFRFES